jgi:hypothetical protein
MSGKISSVQAGFQASNIPTAQPCAHISNVSTNINQLAQQCIRDGIHITLAPPPPYSFNQPFDRNSMPEQYIKDGKSPTLIFSTKSGGQGFKRSVDLTKKSKDKDDTRRIPDQKRIEEQTKLFMEWKHTMGLDANIEVEHLGLKDGLVILKRNGQFIGKYNMKDLGVFEPNGPITGGGGIKQMFRDVSSCELQKDTLRAIADKHEELVAKMLANVEPETGGKLRGHYITENRGNVQGHRAFQMPMSDGAKKIIKNEKWMPSFELFKAFGFMEPERSPGKSDHFKLTPSGKDALNDLCKVRQLQMILEKNLASKIAEKEKEKTSLSSPTPNNTRGLQRITEELNALTNAQQELKEIQPISVTFPIMLFNTTILNPNSNSSIKGKDLFSEKGKLRNDLIEEFARKGEGIIGGFIDQENTHRNFSTFWKKTIDSNPADAQVKTDMGGIAMQAASSTSSDPALNRLIQYAENHGTGNKVAQESRMADFLIHSVIAPPTENLQYGIRSYNQAPEIVQDVFEQSLREHQMVNLPKMADLVSPTFAASAFSTGDGLFVKPENGATFKIYLS